jgi:hypothetical protein
MRFTLPLCTIRRVERLNARAGVYALSLSLAHGSKIVRRAHRPQRTGADTGASQVIQLTALRPTADLFCALLRDALKAELQRGQMKAVRAFVKTCYSEALLAPSSVVAATEREDGSLIRHGEPGGENAEANAPAYHGGLGLKFRFPGDPKKYARRGRVCDAAERVTGSGRRRSSSSGRPTSGVRAPSSRASPR